MSLNITRRDLLKLAGGSALGIFFTPLPWKLLDDSAIWTQNWSLTPPLPRGPLSIRYTTCTLCAGGCGVRANCVAGVPYSVAGIPNHPLSRGQLCPRGLGAHHLPNHPLRLTSPHKFGNGGEEGRLIPVSFDDAIQEIAAFMKRQDGTVAFLDQHPGRAVSQVYREFAREIPHGVMLASPSCEARTLDLVRKFGEGTMEPPGFDFENTGMILSFGAPLVDGWGTPGRMYDLLNNRTSTGQRLIQVESRCSRTAMQADEWFPVNPGSEGLLALTIAHVIVNEHRIPAHVRNSIRSYSDYCTGLSRFSPESTAGRTGISAAAVRHLAEEFMRSPAAIVLGGPDPAAGPLDREADEAIAALNVLAGNVGRRGGIVLRRDIPGYENSPDPVNIADIPDHSIGVLIIDDVDAGYAIPWQIFEKKLVPEHHIVVSLSAYAAGLAAHADYFLPSPAAFECLRDVTTPAGAARASFGLASPLFPQPAQVHEPVEFIKHLAGALGLQKVFPPAGELLRGKVESLFASRRGGVFLPPASELSPLSGFAGADDLWMKFLEGAVWCDEEKPQAPPARFTLPVPRDAAGKATGEDDLYLMPRGWHGAGTSPVPPLMTKVFQESELRERSGQAFINPATSARLGMKGAGLTVLETTRGKLTVQIKPDESVRPGVIEAATGLHVPEGAPDILSLCDVGDNGTWRLTRARISKAET